MKTIKKGFLRQICAKFHEVWREDQKKKSSSRNLLKKRFLSTNTGLMTSILGVSGPELHSSGTESVTSFGAQSSLGGTFLVLGGTSSDLGDTAPKYPPWRRACIRTLFALCLRLLRRDVKNFATLNDDFV